MISNILQHTPTWVFILFVVLLQRGLQQTRTREVSTRMAMILPFAMMALSFFGMSSSFAGALSRTAWLLGVLISTSFVFSQIRPSFAQYDKQRRVFQLAGSWIPLLLMMCLFFAKFVVAVLIAVQPALTHDLTFSMITPLVYGAFSGFFLARGLYLLKLTMMTSATAPTAVN